MKKIMYLYFLVCGLVLANNGIAAQNCDIQINQNQSVYNGGTPVPIKALAQQNGTSCGQINWQFAFIRRVTIAAIAQNPNTQAYIAYGHQGNQTTDSKEFDDTEAFREWPNTIDLLDLSVRTFDINSTVGGNSILQLRPNGALRVFSIRVVIDNMQPGPGPGPGGPGGPFPPGGPHNPPRPPMPPQPNVLPPDPRPGIRAENLQWISLDAQGSVPCGGGSRTFTLPNNLSRILQVNVRFSQTVAPNAWVGDVKLFANQCRSRNADNSCESHNGDDLGSIGPGQSHDFIFDRNSHHQPTQLFVSCNRGNGRNVQVQVKGY